MHHQFNFTIPLSMYIHVWRLLSPELKYPLERSFIQFHEYHLLSAIIEQRIPRILTRLIRAITITKSSMQIIKYIRPFRRGATIGL